MTVIDFGTKRWPPTYSLRGINLLVASDSGPPKNKDLQWGIPSDGTETNFGYGKMGIEWMYSR